MRMVVKDHGCFQLTQPAHSLFDSMRSTQVRNGIGTSVKAMAEVLHTELGYEDETSAETASHLHATQVALLANVTTDDLDTFFSGVVKPSRVLISLAGCICVVFGQPPSWGNALRILLAPDFYDVAMALTPDMLEVRSAHAMEPAHSRALHTLPHAAFVRLLRWRTAAYAFGRDGCVESCSTSNAQLSGT